MFFHDLGKGMGKDHSIVSSEIAKNFCSHIEIDQTEKNIKEEIAFDKPISLNYYMQKDKQILDERKKKEKFAQPSWMVQ